MEETQGCETASLNRLVLDYLMHEGLGGVAAEFARNNNMTFQMSSFLMHRTGIREAIEEGNIDLAIGRINNLNAEIIDGNRELYYFLMEQKACEQMQRSDVEEVLEFVRSELSGLVEGSPGLDEHLENLLEFIVFGGGADAVAGRRRRLAEHVNECILEKYDVGENELKRIVMGIVDGERLLTATHRFPAFGLVSEKEKC